MQYIFINYLKFHKYIGVKTQFPNTRKTFFLKSYGLKVETYVKASLGCERSSLF